MKKVKLSLEDLLSVLEAMAMADVKDIIFLEYDGHPAICDADDPENLITFQAINEEAEGALH